MSSCIHKGGQDQMQVMRALMDCTEMTRMHVDMMMRRPHGRGHVPMCAKTCDICAAACRHCAETRRAMAGATM